MNTAQTQGQEFGDESDELDPQDTSALVEEGSGATSISVSAVFTFDRLDVDGDAPDFDLVACDGVHFVVSAAKLHAKSLNKFGGLLAPSRSVASVPLLSTVLNLLLHAIYGLPVFEYQPTIDDIGMCLSYHYTMPTTVDGPSFLFVSYRH